MVQGELFTEDVSDLKSNHITSFFSRNQLTVGYDKLVLFSIIFIVLFILAYSFGYERGYKAAERKIQSLTAHIETLTAETIATTEPSATSSQTIEVAAPDVVDNNHQVTSQSSDTPKNPSAPSQSKETPVLKGKYTIQIATVLSKDRAEKEISKLTSKTGDLKPFFIKRGKYFEICAGAFDTVLTAKPILSEFKSKNISADAFVRPLA